MQTNPLLESDMITCIHNGIVELKSSNSGIFEVNDMSVITQKDLLNAKILGCANNIAGVPVLLYGSDYSTKCSFFYV